jgi:hypothetical protein
MMSIVFRCFSSAVSFQLPLLCDNINMGLSWAAADEQSNSLPVFWWSFCHSKSFETAEWSEPLGNHQTVSMLSHYWLVPDSIIGPAIVALLKRF